MIIIFETELAVIRKIDEHRTYKKNIGTRGFLPRVQPDAGPGVMAEALSIKFLMTNTTRPTKVVQTSFFLLLEKSSFFLPPLRGKTLNSSAWAAWR
jgi:hypothetical protein